MVVCKSAFHIIHRFSHLQFYKYKTLCTPRGKVGFHGNKGTCKTRPNTLNAKAILEKILRESGEPMPHLVYVGDNGTDNIEYKVPSSFTRSSIFEEMNDSLDAYNMPPIAFSTFQKIWADHFANFKVHNTSAFAKCDKCSILKAQLHGERRKVERQALEKE